MKKYRYYIFPFIIALLVNGCNSTKIISSWKNPQITTHASDWNKILVIALLINETDRRSVEDEIVKYLNGKGVTSYNYFYDNYQSLEDQTIRSKVLNDGFDVAITVRLIDVEEEKIYTSCEHSVNPIYYDGNYRYYYKSPPHHQTSAYYSIAEKFIIETTIYHIENDQIIWSGITETYDPDSVKRLIDEIAFTIRKKLKQEGFIEK